MQRTLVFILTIFGYICLRSLMSCFMRSILIPKAPRIHFLQFNSLSYAFYCHECHVVSRNQGTGCMRSTPICEETNSLWLPVLRTIILPVIFTDELTGGKKAKKLLYANNFAEKPFQSTPFTKLFRSLTLTWTSQTFCNCFIKTKFFRVTCQSKEMRRFKDFSLQLYLIIFENRQA